MNIGVVFPQTEIGHDAGGVRAYAEAVEALGYSHVLAYDHVLGADTAVHTGWRGPYDLQNSFHEPFVLFGFLAGFTSLEVVTGILIGPQRQTALIAKQAAAVDVFTGGKLRLGLGIGWNAVEYEALGKDFGTVGAGWRSRSPCCGVCSPRRASRSRAPTSKWSAPGSARSRCSARSRSGWARRASRLCDVRAGWPTAGSRRPCRTTGSRRRSTPFAPGPKRPAATRRSSEWRAV